MHNHNGVEASDSLTQAQNARIEALVEQRLAARGEAAAFKWRFRLILVESSMMALFVIAMGFAFGMGWAALLRPALLVGATCLGSGMLLIGLSGLATWLLRQLRRWWRP